MEERKLYSIFSEQKTQRLNSMKGGEREGLKNVFSRLLSGNWRAGHAMESDRKCIRATRTCKHVCSTDTGDKHHTTLFLLRVTNVAEEEVSASKGGLISLLQIIRSPAAVLPRRTGGAPLFPLSSHLSPKSSHSARTTVMHPNDTICARRGALPMIQPLARYVIVGTQRQLKTT